MILIVKHAWKRQGRHCSTSPRHISRALFFPLMQRILSPDKQKTNHLENHGRQKGKPSAIQCQFFGALSKVPGLWVTIKCIFLRVFLGLYGYLRHCYENFWHSCRMPIAPVDEVPFLFGITKWQKNGWLGESSMEQFATAFQSGCYTVCDTVLHCVGVVFLPLFVIVSDS